MRKCGTSCICCHVQCCGPVLLCQSPRRNQLISPTCWAHSSKPAARCCSGRMGQKWQTDRRTLYHFIDLALHTMQAVPTLTTKPWCDTYISIITAPTATKQAGHWQGWQRWIWWYDSDVMRLKLSLCTRRLQHSTQRHRPIYTLHRYITFNEPNTAFPTFRVPV